ncbi:unnamed protein product [Acanthosepion pharaonis]|uniref:Uncharacterized protein n=1 Tax=Acanthosepion pharaonis TaxID=158019 RepID=A0A812C620_ACAPH|nr:unnamed protein product [Sepia pharaonis]
MGAHRVSASMGVGVAGSIAHTGVGEMKNKREGEKKNIQDLNDRLAAYISQVRSLQLENTALHDALKKKRKEFDVEPMKEAYQAEIDETKKLLEEANKENAELKVQVTSIEDELEDQRSVCRIHEERIDQLQDKVNSLNDENSHRTAECDMLRRKVEELEHQVGHWKAKYNEVYSQLQATRADLKDETNQRIAEHSRAEALQEELDFLKTVTDAEIKEYKAMLSKEDETGINVRDAWNDELSKCMKELREEYEQRLGDISQELSSRYESQLQQISQSAAKAEPSSVVHSKDDSRKYRTELSQKDMRIKELEGQLERMKMELRSLHSQLDRVNDELLNEKEMRANEVSKLHEEMEAMVRELQMLMDAKLSLELEIAAYRKLLEGEENRLSIGHMTGMIGGYRSESGDALANILDHSSGSTTGDSGSITTATGRITMTRTAKSPFSIHEVDNNGRFVIIENASTYRSKISVNLKGWRLTRKYAASGINQEINLEHVFQNEYNLDAEQTVTIWAKNFEKEADSRKGNIISNIDNWGDMSRTSELELIDDKGVVKATLSIKVTF